MAEMDAEFKARMERISGIRRKQEQEGLFQEPLTHKPQVKTHPPHQSPVKRSGASKATVMAESSDEMTEAKVIPFPNANRVPADCWTMTPDIIRSALFGVSKRGKEREKLWSEKILAVRGVELEFTGERLDQADMDVFMHALSLSREGGLGSKVYFSFYDFLKSLGRSQGKANRDWLKGSLNRLWNCKFKIKTGRYSIGGGLIDVLAEDEVTGQYYLRFNPEMSKSLNFQTFISRSERLKLGRSELAKWLYSYILSQSTDKKPHVVWSKNLQEITGSNSTITKFNENIKKAFKILEKEIPNLLESWSINRGCIKFKKKEA